MIWTWTHLTHIEKLKTSRSPPPPSNHQPPSKLKKRHLILSPSTLVFTPENHAEAQVVTMTGLDGEAPTEVFIVTARTESSDPGFDGLEDRWEYTMIRD